MAKLSEIDEVLIRFADSLSPEAISFKIDGILTPTQVMSRVNQLVDTPDWLTLAKQDALITLKMRQIVAALEALPLTTRSGEVMLQGLERIGNRLDKRQAATEKDLSSLYAFQGTVLLDAVQIALEHMKQTFEVRSGDWDDALESALRLAQIEMSKHDVDNDGAADRVERALSA